MRLSPELRLLVEDLSRIAGLLGPEHRPSRSRDGSRLCWDRYISLADEHQLGSLLGSRIAFWTGGGSGPAAEDRPWGVCVPSAVQTALRARYLGAGLDASFRQPELTRLLDLLGAKAPPVLLKGAALALTLYAEAAEREMSDIDLLFASALDAEGARRILEREGYSREDGPGPERFDAPRARTPSDHHHLPSLCDPIGDLTIELHTNIATPPLARHALEEMWARKQRVALSGGRRFYVLDPISRLIHHALHISSDPIDSPLLRNVFETAWMASELGREDHAACRALASRWGVRPRITGALHLAADLFGSPRIFEGCSRGPFDFWSRRRLEWTGSLGGARSLVGRWKRDIAREHLQCLHGISATRCGVSLLEVALRSLARSAAFRLARWFPRRIARVAPMPVRTTEVAGCVLAHDPRSGSVHLLDRVSSAVWHAVRAEQCPRRIEASLLERGVHRRSTRVALAKLISAGLVRAE